MIIVLSLVDGVMVVTVVTVAVTVPWHGYDVIVVLSLLRMLLLLWWVWPCRGGQEWRQEPSQPMERVRFRRPVRVHRDVGGNSGPAGGRQ